MYYIHKHEISLVYGGPEDGGWWFKAGRPEDDWKPKSHALEDEEAAYAYCRTLNAQEVARQKEEEQYEYTSVLSYLSRHFEYSVHEEIAQKPFPLERPHYE